MSFERRWNGRLILSALAIASAAVAILLGQVRLFQIVHLKAQDLHFLARGRTPAPEIVLVTIDRKSLETIPEPLIFWHRHYAQVIRAAAGGGAKAIGLAVAFSIPVSEWAREDYDGMLLDAARKASSTVPVIFAYNANGVDARFWTVDVNRWARGHRQLAYSNLYTDPDDFVRRLELIAAPPASSGLSRSFALRVAESYLGSEARWEKDGLVLAGSRVPISGARMLAINYPGPPDVFARVSFSDFLDAAGSGQKERIASWVSGKVVLIGSDTLEDRLATPFYTLSGLGRAGGRPNSAPVEAHAAAVHTLLARSYLQPVPEWARVAALIATAA